MANPSTLLTYLPFSVKNFSSGFNPRLLCCSSNLRTDMAPAILKNTSPLNFSYSRVTGQPHCEELPTRLWFQIMLQKYQQNLLIIGF